MHASTLTRRDQIFDDGAGSCVEIVKEGFPDAVVWNPWVEKSKAMGDFGDDEYQVGLWGCRASLLPPLWLVHSPATKDQGLHPFQLPTTVRQGHRSLRPPLPRLQVMLCIEPAVAGSGAVTLQPGKTWNGTQTLTLSNV
jgi:glucose-6-phosphate 1-epimerase